MDKNTKPVKAKPKMSAKEWFQGKFLPAMAKVGNQRYLAAIRDAFGTMIPLIIAGSIGVLINAIVFGGAGSGYVSLLGLFAKAAHPNMAWDDITTLLASTDNSWGQASRIGGLAFGHINTVTVGMMSIWFAFLFGYYIAVSRNFKSPIIAGLISAAGFVLASMGEVAFFMDAKGLIAAIIFGIGVTELFIWLSNQRALTVKLPDSVPPAVGKSFAVFLPAIIALAAVSVVNICFLAPAVVTNNLTVESSAYNVMDPKTFAALFGANKYDVAKLLSADGDLANWLDHKDLIAEMLGKLNVEGTFDNQKAFVDAYNALPTDEAKAMWTTALVQVGHIDHSAFKTLVSGAHMTFAADEKAAGFVAAASWMEIVLGPSQFGASAAIYEFITSWFLGFATGNGGLGLALVFAFFCAFFWFFGIHGNNLMAGIFEPIWWMILGINTTLVESMGYDAAAATGQMGVFTKPFFDAYMQVGGTGGTLGLLVATLIFSRRRDLKEISKYALPPGVFQINEPTIFGFPLVLNPIYVVPFVLNPMLSVIVGWLFSPAVLGFVKYSYIATPWTAPWIIGGVITSLDFHALLPGAIVGLMSFGMYVPFIFLDNMLYFKKLRKSDYQGYLKEMKYYNDPKYRYITDTDTKFDAITNKADVAQVSSEESIEWWTKKLANKPEELDKHIAAITKKRDARVAKLNKEAEDYKAKRLEAMPKYEDKWAKQKAKNTEKFVKHEEKYQQTAEQLKMYNEQK